MSGNKERMLEDYPDCGCEHFYFWIGRDENNMGIVCFNPDAFSTRKVYVSGGRAKRYCLEKVLYIECDDCNQVVNDEVYRDIMRFAYYSIDRE